MIPELVHTLEATVKFAAQLVGDVSDRQMVEQPKGTPNHGAWTLGHIIHSCHAMAAEFGAEPWLPDDWESRFGYGSHPLPNPQQYPAKQELLTLLSDASNRLSRALLTADESVLEQSLPDASLPTMRHLLLQVVVAHTAYHTGQLAVWRRAIGKQSVGVFV
jgi:uncharacterized damage-inducible protein DinB